MYTGSSFQGFHYLYISPLHPRREISATSKLENEFDWWHYTNADLHPTLQEPSPSSPLEALSCPICGQFRSIPGFVYPQVKCPMKSSSPYPSKIDSSDLFSCIISYIRIDSRDCLGLAVTHNPQAIP